jgi:hypothetical protein
MKNWKTTIGGAFSALGTSLAGVGTVSALSGISPKIMCGIALGGFALSALGKFFACLFAQDAVDSQEPIANRRPGSLGGTLISWVMAGSLCGLLLGCTGCISMGGGAAKAIAAAAKDPASQTLHIVCPYGSIDWRRVGCLPGQETTVNLDGSITVRCGPGTNLLTQDIPAVLTLRAK